VNARFWEEMGKQPPSAVIVDRAVRLHGRGFDKLDEALSEADEAFEASVVREIMSKVDQAVEASSPDEPLFATCDKVYNDWQATMSRDTEITLGYWVGETMAHPTEPATRLQGRGTTRQVGGRVSRPSSLLLAGKRSACDTRSALE
jgi:hypothetical protein